MSDDFDEGHFGVAEARLWRWRLDRQREAAQFVLRNSGNQLGLLTRAVSTGWLDTVTDTRGHEERLVRQAAELLAIARQYVNDSDLDCRSAAIALSRKVQAYTQQRAKPSWARPGEGEWRDLAQVLKALAREVRPIVGPEIHHHQLRIQECEADLREIEARFEWLDRSA